MAQQQTKSFAQKILAARSAMGSVKRDSDNQHFKAKYASLSALLDVIEKPLFENGLFVMQKVESEGLATYLYDADTGETMVSVYPISCAAPNDPQKFGSSVTYARRYGLRTMFCLADDDDDGNSAAEAARTQPKAEPKKVPSEDEKRAGKLLKEWKLTEAEFAEFKTMTDGKWVGTTLRADEAGVTNFDELVLFVAGENVQS